MYPPLLLVLNRVNLIDSRKFPLYEVSILYPQKDLYFRHFFSPSPPLSASIPSLPPDLSCSYPYPLPPSHPSKSILFPSIRHIHLFYQETSSLLNLSGIVECSLIIIDLTVIIHLKVNTYHVCHHWSRLLG